MLGNNTLCKFWLGTLLCIEIWDFSRRVFFSITNSSQVSFGKWQHLNLFFLLIMGYKKKLRWNIERQPTPLSKLHHVTGLDLIRLALFGLIQGTATSLCSPSRGWISSLFPERSGHLPFPESLIRQWRLSLLLSSCVVPLRINFTYKLKMSAILDNFYIWKGNNNFILNKDTCECC